jgi:hypothetical protein
MAEHTHSGHVELGAPMDYAEHNRTYEGFITLSKVTVIATIAILQSLLLFGIAANGFWLGVVMLILTPIAMIVSFIAKGSIKALVGVVLLGFVFMALAL